MRTILSSIVMSPSEVAALDGKAMQFAAESNAWAEAHPERLKVPFRLERALKTGAYDIEEMQALHVTGVTFKQLPDGSLVRSRFRNTFPPARN